METSVEDKVKISNLSSMSSGDIDKNDLILVTDISEVDSSLKSKKLSLGELKNYMNKGVYNLVIHPRLNSGINIAEIILDGVPYNLYSPQSLYIEGSGINIDSDSGSISINESIVCTNNNLSESLNSLRTELKGYTDSVKIQLSSSISGITSNLDYDDEVEYEGSKTKFITSVSQNNGLISVTKGTIKLSDLPELNIDNISDLESTIGNLNNSISSINDTINSYVFKSSPSSTNRILTELDISSFTSGINYLGISEVEVTNGGSEIPVIDSTSINPTLGDIVKYLKNYFIWKGNYWECLTNEFLKSGDIVDSDISINADISISKIYGLSSALSNINNSIDEINESLAEGFSELVNNVNTNTSNISSLMTAVSNNTSNISNLENSVSTNTSNISNLSNIVDSNSDSILELTNNYSNLKTIVDNHTTQISEIIGSSFSILINESSNNGYIDINNNDLKVYELPIASSNELGGIKVGNGLSIDSNGVLSSNINSIDIFDEDSGNGISNIEYNNGIFTINRGNFAEFDHTHEYAGVESSGFLSNSDYLMFINGLNTSIEKSDKNGNILLNGSEINIYELPTASSIVKGGVRVGDNLTVDENGILTVNNVTIVSNGLMTSEDKIKLDNLSKVTESDINGNIKINNSEVNIYDLPVASREVLGGIKVGDNLIINNGVLSANYIGSSTISLYANEINLKYNNSDKLLKVGPKGLETEINLVYDNESGIKLLGANGNQIGDTIDPSRFITNGILYSVELVIDPEYYPSGKYIKLGFYINEDDSSDSSDSSYDLYNIKYVFINILDLIPIYSSGDGIEVSSDSSINIKLGDSSGLLVNSDGLVIHPLIINGLNEISNIIPTKVTGVNESTEGNVVIFGSDGYSIKDSGFTISKSVPADAKFTDTIYDIATESNNGLMSASDKYKLNRLDVNTLLSTINTLQSKLDNLTRRFNSYISSDSSFRYKELNINTEENEFGTYSTNEIIISDDAFRSSFSIDGGELDRSDFIFFMDYEDDYTLPVVNLYIKHSDETEFTEIRNVIFVKRIVYNNIEEGNIYQYINLMLLDYSLLTPGTTFYLTFDKLDGSNTKFYLEEAYYNA